MDQLPSRTLTYPQFVLTTDNILQFVYRSGVSGNGATQLAEYNGGSWSNVGSWASASGSYTSNGVTSTLRNLYIHGFTYRSSRLHVTGTWRENAAGVSCKYVLTASSPRFVLTGLFLSAGGLTNHDTTYFYSDDKGERYAQLSTGSAKNPKVVPGKTVPVQHFPSP